MIKNKIESWKLMKTKINFLVNLFDISAFEITFSHLTFGRILGKKIKIWLILILTKNLQKSNLLFR